MKGDKVFEKNSNNDNKFIGEGKGYVKKKIYKWLSIAACFALILIIVTLKRYNPSMEDRNLPMLALESPAVAYGYEGYMAYSIDDLTNANPWEAAMDITQLPVIKNTLSYNDASKVQNPDYTLMKKLLKDAGAQLGMDVKSLKITNDIPDAETKKEIIEKLTIDGGEVPKGYFDIRRMFLEDKNYRLEINTSYTITVEFKNPITLPDNYNFSNNATSDEIQNVGEYLKEEYSEYIGMKHPKINISGGDFNIDAEQLYHLFFFDDVDDDVQNILNYNFNNVAFYPDYDGKLWLARKYYTDLRNVIGNYPIIDEIQAQKLLEDGTYYTTVPEPFTGADYIKKVELIYRTGTREKVYMPYYRFYVEIPQYLKEDTGLHEFGAYYVPAVDGKYIENMQIWGDSFN